MVTVYTPTYNEQLLIRFMVDHYRSRFPECSIIVYDNMSTDNTQKIAIANNCKVLTFDTNNEYQEQRLVEVRNNCWKNALTDWVLICDLDELLDISETELMEEERLGTTMIKTEGYDMINLYDNLDFVSMKYGVRSDLPGKVCLFNKKYISEMNYGPGSHTCNPKGKITYSKKTYKLYHYNSINEDVTVEKFRTRAARLSPENLVNGWGIHYLMTPEQIYEEYKTERNKAVKVR